MPTIRKPSKRQLAAVVELIGEFQTGGERWTIMGPRESDRALLVKREWRNARLECQLFYLVGFGGAITRPPVIGGDNDPREFWPHG